MQQPLNLSWPLPSDAVHATARLKPSPGFHSSPHPEKRPTPHLSPKALSDLPLGISDHIPYSLSVASTSLAPPHIRHPLASESPHVLSAASQAHSLGALSGPCRPLLQRHFTSEAFLTILRTRNTNTTALFSPTAFNTFQDTVQLIQLLC